MGEGSGLFDMMADLAKDDAKITAFKDDPMEFMEGYEISDRHKALIQKAVDEEQPFFAGAALEEEAEAHLGELHPLISSFTGI